MKTPRQFSALKVWEQRLYTIFDAAKDKLEAEREEVRSKTERLRQARLGQSQSTEEQIAQILARMKARER